MALVPTYKVIFSNNLGDYLTIYDYTGLYSGTNTGGWGSPNAELNTITAADVSVLDYSGTEVETFDLLSNYPFSSTTEVINLNNYDWGLDDGYYKFVFSITADGTDYSYTYESVYLNNAKNCLEKLWYNAYPKDDCVCVDQKIKGLAKELQLLFYGIKAAATSYNLANVNKLIIASNKICSISDKYCP